MHVLALYEEGQWPHANILLTTKDAFEEALNQTNIIEQQCIEYGEQLLTQAVFFCIILILFLCNCIFRLLLFS